MAVRSEIELFSARSVSSISGNGDASIIFGREIGLLSRSMGNIAREII